MDKNRIAGTTQQIKGSVKETIGRAACDAKLQSDGKTKKVEATSRTLSATLGYAPKE
jgi:uncharacterized protein YjbJ (UPF0337 family)